MKKIAIIGGGIFGVSCALELASEFEVVIFEQEDDVMSKGTFANQYRHHYGFHYPRSKETVRQCLEAQESFRSRWQDAIIEDIPSYYAVAKEGSKVSGSEFIKFCDDMKLQYEFGYPDSSLLNIDLVDTCILTNEPVYDIFKLKKMSKFILNKNKSTDLRLSSKVVNAKYNENNGKKILCIKRNGIIFNEEFDYVVNATYANQNLFKNWLGFDALEIEFRLKELPIVKLETNLKQAVTIMDGEFVTIVPFAHSGLYTLGDVERSILEIKFSFGGVPWNQDYINSLNSKFEEIKESNYSYIPLIKSAKYVRSMYAVLPTLPKTESTDARLTTITSHGKGCWSVFEGKIVTSVKAAQDVAGRIRNEK